MEGFFVLYPEVYSCLLFLFLDNQLFISVCLIVVCQLAIAHQKQHNYVNNPPASCPAATLLGVLQINRLVRENLKNHDRIIHYRNGRIYLYDLRAY